MPLIRLYSAIQVQTSIGHVQHVLVAVIYHSMDFWFVVGLGYGSDSEEEDDEETVDDNEDSDKDSDRELEETIQRKKKEFAEKMKNQAIYEDDEIGK